jgi:hypothetical protein
MSGTSMANPFAVGCASLLLSYSRQTKSLKLNNTADYISIFSQCASQLKNKKFRTKEYQGYGILRLPNI